MRTNKKSKNVVKIISSSNDELKKQIVANYSKYAIDSYDLFLLTQSINDDEYKIGIINNLDKYSYKDYQVIGIICSIKDDDLKSKLIFNYKKYNIDEFDVYTIINSMSDKGILNLISSLLKSENSQLNAGSIIKYLKDSDLKKEFIEKREDYKLDTRTVANIIGSIKDDEYKKQVINDYKKYGFDSFCLSDIVISLSDDDYRYTIIKNYDKYELFPDDIKYIAESFIDNRYVFSMINGYESFGFDNELLSGLISILRDDDYKTKTIFENKYGFNNRELIKIVESLSGREIKQEVINELFEKGAFGVYDGDKKITLPDDMTIGIEIETEGSSSRYIKSEILPKGWCSKSDATLRKGNEAVSPILHKGDEGDIYKVCMFLAGLGQRVSERCAAHVHIGAQYFEDDVDAYKCLVELYTNVEDIIYLISNEKGNLPRSNVSSYANPFNLKVSEAIKDDLLRFDLIQDVTRFAQIVGTVQGTRYSSINFKNLGKVHKNTIEFRAPNGTLNPEVWINNINLFGGIMCAAKRVSSLFKVDFDSLSREDKLYLHAFESLKDDLDECEKLEILLSLLPEGIDKNEYLDRYDTNSKMYHAALNVSFLQLIASIKPIDISTCDEELKKKINDNYRRVFLEGKTSIR